MSTNEKTVKEFYIEDILKIVLETAALLLKNGADVRRVEDTMIRICKAYCLENPEVFSITSFVIITASDKNGKTFTQTKRIYNSAMDLTVLEDVNALSREICEKPVSPSYVMKRLSEIKNRHKKVNLKICAGNIIAAGSFSMFFGGNLRDALSAVIITFILFFGNIYILKPKTNRILYTFSMSALMGISSIIAVYAGLGEHVDKIIIGDVMLLIPGMALINSITDMFCGDIVTGTTRVVSSVLTALSIAAGFLFSFAVLPFNEISGYEEIYIDAFLQTFFAFTGSVGFAIALNAKKTRIMAGGVSGGISWGIYLCFLSLTDSIFTASIISSSAAYLCSAIFSRVQRAPINVFFAPALIPMLPGGGLYYTINALIKNDISGFLRYGKETLWVSFGLVIGFIVCSFIWANITDMFLNRRNT